MADNWYYYDFSGNKLGPIDWETLRYLAASSKISPDTQIVTPEGQTTPASKITELQFGIFDPMGAVQEILDTFKKTDFKKEIIPIDANNAKEIFKDPIFWVVLTLGILPLLITSFNNIGLQTYGMLFFFAMLWGGIFRGLVLKSSSSIVFPIVAFFFTGIVGINTLLFCYNYLPSVYMNMPNAENNPLIRLFGFVFQVGFCEEFCKILPVVLYLIWKRKKASPMMILLIGVFSGLGFAAFENINYAERNVSSGMENILQTFEKIMGSQNEDQIVQELQTGSLRAAMQTLGAMINVMLRSVSLVFAHAIWSGIFSYYILCAVTSGKRWVVFCCLGLAVSMVLHGVYDWLCDLQPVFAALIVGGSFILFYGYLSKIRQQLQKNF
jgi:RsiW-degrading membrane proteinase PrsW (M82 family)